MRMHKAYIQVITLIEDNASRKERGKSLASIEDCMAASIKGLEDNIKMRKERLVSVSLFNGISTFVGYLMPKPFSLKNSSGTI